MRCVICCIAEVEADHLNRREGPRSAGASAEAAAYFVLNHALLHGPAALTAALCPRHSERQQIYAHRLQPSGGPSS